MDLRISLANAHIVRVALIDDDLSDQISSANLRQIDNSLEDLLADSNDPDRQTYIDILHKLDYNPMELVDLATPLSDQAVRNAAPERLRIAAEQILESRQGFAAPVERVKELLIASGISEDNIDTYYGPSLPQDKCYDLIIIDYYLVNDATDQTVPFIRRLIESHADQQYPLQLIVMSSHEEGLRQDFRNLRPEAEVSSSRMRILAKPRNAAQLAAWKLTLEQLATDRAHVPAIETFVKEAIAAMNRSVHERSRKLWGLDLQAMKLLHETATGDNDDFSRYVEECLSRYLLSRLEECHEVRQALEQLHDQFEQNGSPVSISSGAEIGDSRAAVRDVMTSMVWRGEGTPELRQWPQVEEERLGWVQAVLRFGMVLRDPQGRLWLNLTQSCDLAQAEPSELPELSLLFISGALTNPASSPKKSNAIVYMSAPMAGAGTELIYWQLRRVYTPSVADFGNAFGTGWSVVGELRQDQALNVVASYGAQATRVALQRSVRSWAMRGIALTAGELHAAAPEAPISGFEVIGQTVLRGQDKYELHFELAMFNALQERFPEAIGDSALLICSGVPVKLGKPLQGDPYLIHCEKAPETMEALRAIHNNAQWLEREGNQGKVIIAVWSA